jgi:hypothetical protein
MKPFKIGIVIQALTMIFFFSKIILTQSNIPPLHYFKKGINLDGGFAL